MTSKHSLQDLATAVRSQPQDIRDVAAAIPMANEAATGRRRYKWREVRSYVTWILGEEKGEEKVSG